LKGIKEKKFIWAGHIADIQGERIIDISPFCRGGVKRKSVLFSIKHFVFTLFLKIFRKKIKSL